MNKIKLYWLSVFCAVGFSGVAQAEVQVIANKAIADTPLSKAQVSALYLGATRSLPSGKAVVIVDQESDEDVYSEFYEKIVQKSPQFMKSHWSGIVFSGRGEPPESLLDDEEVVEFVNSNPKAIGYVSGDADIGAAKVLLRIK